MRKLKSRLQDLSECRTKEKQSATSEGMRIAANAEASHAAAAEQRLRQTEEHRSLLAEEAERTSIDVEHERAEVQMRQAQGRKYTDDEISRMAVQCAELNSEKRVVALQVQLLQQEKSTLEVHLQEAHELHRTEMRKLQAANFQVSAQAS